jgi:hypothetical protein
MVRSLLAWISLMELALLLSRCFCQNVDSLCAGLGNKSDNEGTGVSKREAGVRNGLNEFLGVKNWFDQANWRNKSMAAAQ